MTTSPKWIDPQNARTLALKVSPDLERYIRVAFASRLEALTVGSAPNAEPIEVLAAEAYLALASADDPDGIKWTSASSIDSPPEPSPERAAELVDLFLAGERRRVLSEATLLQVHPAPEPRAINVTQAAVAIVALGMMAVAALVIVAVVRAVS